MAKVYEYGGKHFIPYSKVGKIKSISEIKLRSDFELGFCDQNFFNMEQKFCYSHGEFYIAMNNSEMDIFQCVENGKFYIPGEHELFIYEGKNNL